MIYLFVTEPGMRMYRSGRNQRFQASRGVQKCVNLLPYGQFSHHSRSKATLQNQSNCKKTLLNRTGISSEEIWVFHGWEPGTANRPYNTRFLDDLFAPKIEEAFHPIFPHECSELALRWCLKLVLGPER